MMMMRLWTIASSIVFALLLSIKIQETNAIRICGTSLADTLAFACADRGGFHTPVRRSVAKGHVVLKRDVVYLMKTKPRSFYKPSSIAPSKTVPDSMERRSLHGGTWINGVVDECCRKSCTYETLISYCASTGASTTPPTAFNEFFNKVGYHSSEEFSKIGDENVGSSEEVQSDQPANADGTNLETQLEDESHRTQGGLSTGRYGQVQTLRRRPNIGMYSRNRPYFFVVSSHFNGHNEYPAFVN